MPKVSVLITTHNRANLLKRAVLSVLSQTFQDFEIIIVDDASTDPTTALVTSIGDPRIKYLRHDRNRGVAAARNTALLQSVGDYVAFLDDDDEWLPAKLQCQVEMLEVAAPEIGAVYCGYYDVDGSSGRIISIMNPNKRGRIFEQILAADGLASTSTFVLRRECFEKIGLFDESISFCDDFDYWLRIAKEFEIDFVEQPLVNYTHGPGLTQNYRAIIAGTESILAKYSEAFQLNRGLYGQRLQKIGTCYCLLGDMTKGRELFCAAMKRSPLAMKNYFSLILSMTGPKIFKTYYAVKDRLLAKGVRLQRVAGESCFRGKA